MRRRRRRRRRICLPALSLLAVCLFTGCGGGSSTSTVVVVPSSPAAAAHTQATVSSADAVASVAGVPIAKASYEHWLAVEQAGGATTNAGHRALSFLITSQWVIGEAAARKLSVSEAEVKQRFAQISKQSFPKAGSLQKFLAKAEETEADLLARVKVELLESRISAQVTAGKSQGQRTALLASFQKAFQIRWKRYTTCKPGYVMEDCSEYKGKPEDLTAPTSSSSSSSPSSSSSSSSSSSKSSHSGVSHSSTSGASSSPTSGASNSSGEIPGFQPALAEEEYGQGKLLMGEAATTYGVYSRP